MCEELRLGQKKEPELVSYAPKNKPEKLPVSMNDMNME